MFSFHFFFLSLNFSFPIFYLLFPVNLFCLQRKRCNSATASTVATLQQWLRFTRSTFLQHRKRVFSTSRKEAVSGQRKTSDIVSCALPASVHIRCASEAGKRGSDAVSELPNTCTRLQRLDYNLVPLNYHYI